MCGGVVCDMLKLVITGGGGAGQVRVMVWPGWVREGTRCRCVYCCLSLSGYGTHTYIYAHMDTYIFGGLYGVFYIFFCLSADLSVYF